MVVKPDAVASAEKPAAVQPVTSADLRQLWKDASPSLPPSVLAALHCRRRYCGLRRCRRVLRPEANQLRCLVIRLGLVALFVVVVLF